MSTQDDKVLEAIKDVVEMKGKKYIHNGASYTRVGLIESVLNRKFFADIGFTDLALCGDSEFKARVTGLIEKIKPTWQGNNILTSIGDVTFHNIDRDMLTPLVNVENSKTFYYHQEANSILTLDDRAVKLGMSSEQYTNMLMRKKDCIFRYDPYEIGKFVEVDYCNLRLTRINTYNPPKWRLIDKETKIFDRNTGIYGTPMPKDVEIFLLHIFPKKEAREYFLCWAKEAIIGRNETYLVLNGAKGLGKGLLCELMGSLVGKENYTFVPVGYKESQFNSFMQDTRIVVYDEFKVDKDAHTRLKRYINSTQNIEAKGKDAVTKDVYCSSIITNNDEQDMHLESDDRRFSVLDLGTTNLNKLWAEKRISEFSEAIKDETSDLVVQFGNYLLEYDPFGEYNKTMPYRGDKYFRLVYQTLSDWQKFLVELVQSKEKDSYDFVELSGRYNRQKTGNFGMPKSYRKLNDFITNYFDKDGQVIAKWQGRLEDGDLTLMPSEKYLPDDVMTDEETNVDFFGGEDDV
jgi:hypothetical protein